MARTHSVDTDASYVYNENGRRVKTVNGVVTDYAQRGKNIVHMTRGNNNLHFFYDASNKPTIVDFNGSKYAYVHSLQGDIVAILDSNGAAVVQYKYDAWGKPISKTGSMKDSLGTLNPFRYRGYVYDEESGLYYLRSRYYAPSWCRFTNADILVVRNSYCYCGNASLGKYDPDGTEECVVPDYTASINSELQYQLGRFKEHDVSVYQDDSLAQLINTHLGWFMDEVKDGSTISYKTDSVWNQTFTDLPSASHVRTFKFRSYVMTREDLGNFAFGYLGSAMGYSKQNLLIGAGFYKRYKRNKEDAEGNTREFVDLVNKTAEDLLNHYPAAYGNDANDLSMIILGIQEYYTDYPEEE